jgi:hypothetical protein
LEILNDLLGDLSHQLRIELILDGRLVKGICDSFT